MATTAPPRTRAEIAAEIARLKRKHDRLPTVESWQARRLEVMAKIYKLLDEINALPKDDG